MTSMSDKSQKFVRLPYTGKSVVAIDFDEVNKKIYWSSVDDKMIMRGKLDGSEKEIFLRYKQFEVTFPVVQCFVSTFVLH